MPQSLFVSFPMFDKLLNCQNFLQDRSKIILRVIKSYLKGKLKGLNIKIDV